MGIHGIRASLHQKPRQTLTVSPSTRWPQGVTHFCLLPLFLIVPAKGVPSALLGRKGTWVPRGQDYWDLPCSWTVLDAEPSSPFPVLPPFWGLG